MVGVKLVGQKKVAGRTGRPEKSGRSNWQARKKWKVTLAGRKKVAGESGRPETSGRC